MEGQQAFPDPVPGQLWTPHVELPVTLKIRYSPVKSPQRCDDCLICLLMHLQGRLPDGARVPGAALPAVYRRTQGKRVLALCLGHYELRREKEERDDEEST